MRRTISAYGAPARSVRSSVGGERETGMLMRWSHTHTSRHVITRIERRLIGEPSGVVKFSGVDDYIGGGEKFLIAYVDGNTSKRVGEAVVLA